MKEPAPNPYVGPAPYRRNDWRGFYGREDDLRRLAILFIARRIVLLYSPSGAGKTSLVQAGLIPVLEEEGFTVLPTVRLKQEPPDSMTDSNRFVYSAILSLEATTDNGDGTVQDQGLEDGFEQVNGDAAGAYHDLSAYWRARREGFGVQPVILFFDQFEEVLTLDVHDHDTKLRFFDQLGEMLALDEQMWALFAIREDYLAELDPYRYLVPGKFGDAYRLELLNEQQALAAIRNPARDVGVSFPGEVAHRLVEELQCTQVKQRDGTVVLRTGRFVEPVQIQIVCDTLWQERQLEKGDVIEPHWFGAADHVDRALGDFYDRKVAQIAEKYNADERDVRHFFDRDLITEDGLRGQVMDSDEMALSAAVIRDLVDAHLVRAEERRGIQWYELAHDRLVKPIREHNETWYRENLSLLQLRAETWRRTPDKELLLQGPHLQEAECWARGRTLKSYEEAFLAASRSREQAQRWKRILTAAILVLISVLVVGMFSLWRKAEGQRQAAEVAREKTEMLATRANDLYELARKNEVAALRNAQVATTREAEALAAQDEANAAQAQAESLRLADSAEVFMERGNWTAALLAGRRAIMVSETDAALGALRTAIEDVAQEPAPGDAPALQALACNLAGRNMTLNEWQDTFQAAEYETICPQYGADLSYVEEALLTCEGTAEARSRYAVAEQATAEGRVLDFDEWALPLLLKETVATEDESRLLSCLHTAQETRLEFDLAEFVDPFIELKEQLDELATSFVGNVSNERGVELLPILQRVEMLDEGRQSWPTVVAAAFDERFADYYRQLCVNLLSLEASKQSCVALNRLLQRNAALALTVPITRTATTVHEQEYVIHGEYGDVARIDVQTLGDSGKPAVSLADAEGTLIGRQNTEAGTLFDVVLPATGNYLINVSWDRTTPYHSLAVNIAKPTRVSVGSAVEARAGKRIWRFEANAGDNLVILMEAQGKGDPFLSLRDQAGQLVAENDDFAGTRDSRIQVQIPASGEYFVDAGWYGNSLPASYRLLILEVENLAPGDSVQGLSTQREWAFDGRSGDLVSIRVEGLDGASAPWLHLVHPDGYVVAADEPSQGTDHTLEALLIHSGRYYVSLSWPEAAGPYRLSLNHSEPEALVIGETVAGKSGGTQLWAFEGSGGDVVNIVAEARSAEHLPYIHLTDEFGRFLALDEVGDDHIAIMCGVLLPANGRYLVELGWFGSSGPYSLSFEAADTRVLQIGDTVQGRTNEECHWQFEGQQGDFILLTVEAPDGGGDPSLTLRDTGGRSITFDEADEDSDARVGVVLPADGLYSVHTSWIGAPGPYTISLLAQQPAEIVAGEIVQEVHPEQSAWQFEGRQGEALTIAMEAHGSESAPLIALYDESGVPVARVDNGEGSLNTELRTILPEEGRYFIYIGWRNRPVTYTFSVNAVTPGVLQLPNSEVQGGSNQWVWQFEGLQGDYITIAMDALETGGDPLVRVYDARGRYLLENDDYENTNSFLTLLLPQSGVYYVEAGWYTNPGRYRLHINRRELAAGVETASVLLDSAILFFRTGYIIEGLNLIEQVRLIERDSAISLLSAGAYNQACRYGSLWGYAAEALSACDMAVVLEPENGGYFDSRGLARAMTGDFEGAIEDFRAFLAWRYGGNGAWRHERETWIEALQVGQNPFDDPELLDYLRLNE